MYKVRKSLTQGDVEMRKAYCDALVELAKDDPRIMVLDVDCMHSMGTEPFMRAYPERYINCGIQEANAVCVAAGLSSEGMIPFFNAFGVFATRRAYDQVFLSCGYAKLNVKIVGWDAGISAETNGGTHMPFEDAGIMRSIPDMTVLEPADTASMQVLVRAAAEHNGNVYIRSLRKKVIEVYEPGLSLPIGKAAALRPGGDLTIIATGMMVKKALTAAVLLEEQGIHSRVLDMYCLKPLDEESVIACARETGGIVTAENHSLVNGLYGAVAACVAGQYPVPVEGVGVDDQFGEVGKLEYLSDRFQLTEKRILEKAKRVMERKSIP